jgi:hypothetical protein
LKAIWSVFFFSTRGQGPQRQVVTIFGCGLGRAVFLRVRSSWLR